MNPPRLLLLDLDGTVLDDSGLPAALRRACEVVAAEAPGTSAEQLMAANAEEWRTLWPEVEDDFLLDSAVGPDAFRRAWRGTLARCGIRDPAALDRAVAAWQREEAAALRVYPDAAAVLATLSRAGTRIGMVTNGSGPLQRRKLAAVGLSETFEPLVVSSEVGVRKPDPAIFEHALAVARVPPGEALFVGDNLWHDVPGAAAIGIPTAWIDRDGIPLDPSWPQPDRVLRSLADLLQDPR